MKLTPRTFKIQWDLHAWSGVVSSVLLFVIFYCGIFALFHADFSRWQRPAGEPAELIGEPSRVSYDRVVAHLEQGSAIPRGSTLMIRLPLGERVEPGVATVSVYHEATDLTRDLTVDRISGEPVAERAEHSRLAGELYALHFFYQVPFGVELSGLAALALFVAIISGLVIQWKDLARQIRRFRPRLSLRFSSSDAHKVLGVFGLPFATMFAWSGAILGLWAVLALPLQHGAYGGDSRALDLARGYRAPAPAPSNDIPTRRSTLDDIVAAGVTAARAHWSSELQVERLDIERYGDDGARYQVGFGGKGFEENRSVVLDAGARVMSFDGGTSTPTEVMDRVLFDLHYARFGGYLVKACYALLALAVCVVIVTGNLVWLERRDRLRSRIGNRLLERLTLGVCLGLITASAVYCLANRWVPAGVPERGDLEFGIFLAAWACTAALAFVRLPVRKLAAYACGAAALAFAGVIIGDVATRPRYLAAAFAGHDVPTLAALLVIGALAFLCGGQARGLMRAPVIGVAKSSNTIPTQLKEETFT